MNTAEPSATEAARQRAAKPTGGGAMPTQPDVHVLAMHDRPLLHSAPQLPQF
jgi:hypothetical protein